MTTPKRPYLLKAGYDWIIDNDMTPYLLVDADYPQVVIPTEFVEDGQIILNIGVNAVRHLVMDNDAVSFEAKFSGKPMQVYVPIPAALAVYSKEDGDGVFFPEENFPESPNTEPPNGGPPNGFTLRVVK